MMRWIWPVVAFLAPPVDPGHANLHVKIPLLDNVQTCANIFRPTGSARVPAILVRTPYGKGTRITDNYQAFVDRGYAVVVQDVRGRYDSGGVFDPHSQEPSDGDDTIRWIVRQNWSDGQVGMMGGSYLGIVQWKVATLDNPHLKAIFPVVSGYDDYRDRFYSTGGALKLGSRLLWMSQNLHATGFQPPDFTKFVLHLPLRSADQAATGQRSEMFQNALDHPVYDEWWKQRSTRERITKVRVPVFAAGGWYDNFVQSDLEAFTARRAAGLVHHLVVGPWPHNMSIPFDGVDFGPDSKAPLRAIQLEWFDRWMKGRAPATERPALRMFVMGANRWREEDSWPPARARMRELYLHSSKRANGLSGDGALRAKPERNSGVDRFDYDPRSPVPTRGGPVCCNPKIFAWGPADQRPVERRADVLVYTSPPLDAALEVSGPVRAVLWVSTSALDTDFTAKLVDVFPDGTARNLTDGILRLRYRESIERLAPAVEPGKVYQITVDAGPTSNLFLPGHSIRLEISSSNFPRFDRNPNTGRPVADETEMRVARQSVYHDAARPSHVRLPVVE